MLVLFEALILGAVGVWTAGGFLQTERTRETERKGAEQALHDSAILLNETQELAKIGGWAYDAATKTVLWSDEVYRIHEVSSRDYNPSSAVRDVAFYAPEDQATIDEAFRGAVDEGRPYDLELRLITATGREIWVRTAGRPQFRDGRVVRVYGHIQDITERKMAEEELRTANERVRRLFDANLFGSLIVRENGAILEANDYYLDLIGHTRDELERGELDWRAITPAEWLPVSDDAIGRTIAGGASLPYEKEYLRADGTRVPVLVAVTHLSGPDEVIAGIEIAVPFDDDQRGRAVLSPIWHAPEFHAAARQHQLLGPERPAVVGSGRRSHPRQRPDTGAVHGQHLRRAGLLQQQLRARQQRLPLRRAR